METSERYHIETDTKDISKSGVEVFITPASIGAGICTTQAHIHQAVEFLYITDGSFKVFVDDDEFDIFKGDLIMFRSNSIHRIFTTDNGRNEYLVIKIKPDIFTELSSTDESTARIMRFILHDKAKIVWRCDELKNSSVLDSIRTINSELSAPLSVSDVALKISVVSLLINILRLDDELGDSDSYAGCVSVSRQIYKAITYINRNYERNISAADCAAHVNMSYSYFSRSFKDVTKKSFRQYLNVIRINHAEKELTLTDRSVTEICFSCGFSDVSYFIAQYKVLRGKTPHKFRKEL